MYVLKHTSSVLAMVSCLCSRIFQELSLDKLREMQGQTHEDPLREVAALQYLSSEGHPNVLTCTEVNLKDEIQVLGGEGRFGV